MALKDIEIKAIDKRSFVYFQCSPQLKSDFCKAISEIGEFNTYTDFFVAMMRDYINKHKDMKL